jgi:hypothetical protein
MRAWYAFRLSFVYENSSSHVRWWFDILSFVMKNVYEVLRQKELELSRLEKEVEVLRVVAPLLSEDDEADNDNKPTLARARATNAAPQPDHSGWDDTATRP